MDGKARRYPTTKSDPSNDFQGGVDVGTGFVLHGFRHRGTSFSGCVNTKKAVARATLPRTNASCPKPSNTK